MGTGLLGCFLTHLTPAITPNIHHTLSVTVKGPKWESEPMEYGFYNPECMTCDGGENEVKVNKVYHMFIWPHLVGKLCEKSCICYCILIWPRDRQWCPGQVASNEPTSSTENIIIYYTLCFHFHQPKMTEGTCKYAFILFSIYIPVIKIIFSTFELLWYLAKVVIECANSVYQ